MNILESHDNTREGNDCQIYDLWQLVSVFGEKRIIRCQRVDGYRGQDLEVTVVSSPDYDTPKIVKKWFARL